jgi:nitric oxide reductase subunit B
VSSAWIAWTALRNFRSGTTTEELPEHPLYTETTAPADEAPVTAKD